MSVKVYSWKQLCVTLLLVWFKKKIWNEDLGVIWNQDNNMDESLKKRIK